MAIDLPTGRGTAATMPAGLAIARYLLQCHTASLGVSRIPAKATPGQRLALFLPGILTTMDDACWRVTPLISLFDVVVCELPGHGISREVDDVSPAGFAREYAALIDRYVPAPRPVTVIGESYGGLVGAALASLRPDRVEHLVLLDTPFCLTRPPLATLLSERWRRFSLSPYIRRILVEVFNVDPQDGSGSNLVDHCSMLAELAIACTILAGCEDYAFGNPPAEWRPPSQLTNADLATLQSYAKVAVVPRIQDAGHCLLLDNPAACIAALSRHLGCLR